MAKATIKTDTGAVITIEGSKSEVSHLLHAYERPERIHNAKAGAAKQTEGTRMKKKRLAASDLILGLREWPAPGSEDTELGVFMGPEVSHGATKVYAGVQA